jgi:hypothetical protein
MSNSSQVDEISSIAGEPAASSPVESIDITRRVSNMVIQSLFEQ